MFASRCSFSYKLITIRRQLVIIGDAGFGGGQRKKSRVIGQRKCKKKEKERRRKYFKQKARKIENEKEREIIFDRNEK